MKCHGVHVRSDVRTVMKLTSGYQSGRQTARERRICPSHPPRPGKVAGNLLSAGGELDVLEQVVVRHVVDEHGLGDNNFAGEGKGRGRVRARLHQPPRTAEAALGRHVLPLRL